MKSIYSLVPDIQKLLVRKDGWFDAARANTLSQGISGRLQRRFATDSNRPTLRLSGMGPRCPRALWYSIHHPELGEPLPPWAEAKFALGDFWEVFGLICADASGHDVRGEQDEVVVNGVKGHRDAVVDGCILDLKSCSQFAFEKLKTKSIKQDDSFGYLDQLDGYLVGSLDDPLVTVKDKAYLLGIDKVLGHMVLYEHELRASRINARIVECKEIVGRSSPPDCNCKSIPEGKSGNLKLDVRASYEPFKYCCQPHTRTFLYASGPVYLTTVKRKPDVPEIDRNGKLISHF